MEMVDLGLQKKTEHVVQLAEMRDLGVQEGGTKRSKHSSQNSRAAKDSNRGYNLDSMRNNFMQTQEIQATNSARPMDKAPVGYADLDI